MNRLIVGAMLVLASAGYAAGPERCEMRGPRVGMEGANDPIVRLVANPKVAEKIGLSEEQRKQIKEIDKANKEGLGDLRKKLREAMERQAELLKAEKIDESSVMAEIDKTFEIRKEMAKCQIRRVIKIKSILTPEQIKNALATLENRPKRAKGAKAAEGAQPAKE